MSDDQIEIEIDEIEVKGNEPDIEIVKTEDEIPAKASKREIDPDEGLEDFKAKYERERAGRIEAERFAREHADRAVRAQNEAQDSNLHLVTNAIQNVQQTNEILKANYREAMSVGDYDRVADIQTEMSTNAARLLQLEQGKQALESEPKHVQQPYIPSDPVEAVASQLSARSADWVRAHPEYATDQRLFNKMVAAHNLVVADGISPDTREYFESIEDVLKIRDRDDDASSAASKPVQRRSSPPSAPVTRSGAGAGPRPNTVRLNASEREMAQMMGMTDQEYARNKLALQKEGKLN
jgi:hypothetical protein